jgi:hypothetical protein
MSPLSHGEVFMMPKDPGNIKNETVSWRKVRGTSDSKFLVRNDPNPYGRNPLIQQGRSLGTDLGNTKIMPRKNIDKGTFLDNEVGQTIRAVKEKFGKAPFIKAYKRVLDTSKKIDDEWEKYLAEEVRLRSLLEAGDD